MSRKHDFGAAGYAITAGPLCALIRATLKPAESRASGGVVPVRDLVLDDQARCNDICLTFRTSAG